MKKSVFLRILSIGCVVLTFSCTKKGPNTESLPLDKSQFSEEQIKEAREFWKQEAARLEAEVAIDNSTTTEPIAKPFDNQQPVLQAYQFVPRNREVENACAVEAGKTYCKVSGTKNDADEDCKLSMKALGKNSACAANMDSSCRDIVSVNESCYQNQDSCKNLLPNSCGYYSQCLEAQHQCGLQGYGLGYGHKYCYRFKDINFTSNAGRIWRDETLVCLQQEISRQLLLNPKMSCTQIEDFAFDSHSRCYLNSGSSICLLPAFEKTRIFFTVDTKDIMGKRGRKQALEVARSCLGFL